MSKNLKLLAIHAHPDDESSKTAATLAYYRNRGHPVMVATVTGGERGDILNEAAKSDPLAHRDITGLRRKEMAEAKAALGVEHRWLGFVDSGLPEITDDGSTSSLPWGSFATLPLAQAAAPLVRLVREFKPHVLITYDENGGYPHPDHIKTHQIAVEAYEKAGDSASYTDLGEPWNPLKLYYDVTFIPERFEAFDRALESMGKEPVFSDWVESWRREAAESKRSSRSVKDITTRIPAAEFFAVRDRALLAHASQIDPNGSFFAVPSDKQAEYWPTEDFVLAQSRVGVDLPEDDLFSGVEV